MKCAYCNAKARVILGNGKPSCYRHKWAIRAYGIKKLIKEGD